jgi:uncharacterized protein (TIGR02266 family)
MDSDSERRTLPRAALAVEVSFTSDSNFYTGLTGNLSEGGVFVSTYQQLPEGSRVAIEFSLPSGVIQVKGIVRWTRKASEGVTPGVGVQFEDLSGDARVRIAEFCEQREPLYYDVDDA